MAALLATIQIRIFSMIYIHAPNLTGWQAMAQGLPRRPALWGQDSRKTPAQSDFCWPPCFDPLQAAHIPVIVLGARSTDANAGSAYMRTATSTTDPH